MTLKAFITGCAGTELSSEERAYFAHHRPCGFILFQRNCENPEQLKALIDSVREAVQDEKLLVLVDQEGGKVSRLKPPHWTDFPPGMALGNIYRDKKEEGLEIVRQISQWLGSELYPLGINVNCVPVLDIPVAGAHDIIGNRAYGDNANDIIEVAKAVIAGHRDAGLLPVIKHIPGHGRAGSDSHEELPVIETDLEVLRATDFIPFKALNGELLGMTGHLLLPQLDKEDPVSTSAKIISGIIRQEIGFDGLLMSDDLGMEALDGNMSERTSDVLAAGCDVALHCNGHFDEMEDVAAASPVLEGAALERLNRAKDALCRPKSFDKEQISAWLDEHLHEYV